MQSRPSEIPELKALLQSRVESLARDLAPDGSRSGKYWIAKNPTRQDKIAGSFWIALSGVPGSWRDEATGEKGDVLGLICYCQGLLLKDAIQWAKGWLGLINVSPDELRRQGNVARQAVAPHDEAAELAALNEKRRSAFGYWLKCEAKILDTPVDTYLRTRGIDLRHLAAMPGALRFDPACRHAESGQVWPTIVSAMTDQGPVTAIHRTFLMPDGSGKAPVTPARKIWPTFKGAVIRLAKGASKKTPEQAAKAGLIEPLVICEGVEDGLSIALACPELRVWAAGTLGNLASIQLPSCCNEVIVAADNDWGKPQAEQQLKRAIDALAVQGRPVKIARSSVGKDANDALRN